METNWRKNTALFLTSQTLSLFGTMIVQYAIMWHIVLKTQSGVMMTISNCFIKFNSNGDYLTREILDKLVESGLNAIFLTLHTPKGNEYNDEDRLSAFEKFFNKLELDYKINEIIPNEKIVCDMDYKGLRLLTEAHNWNEYGNDRGGSIESLSAEVRNTPCVRPIREFTIAFDGRIYPCCQFCPDCKDSEKSMIAKLSSSLNLFDAYASENLTEWRRFLFPYGTKHNPCSSCKDKDYSKTDTKQKRSEIINNLNLEKG